MLPASLGKPETKRRQPFAKDVGDRVSRLTTTIMLFAHPSVRFRSNEWRKAGTLRRIDSPRAAQMPPEITTDFVQSRAQEVRRMVRQTWRLARSNAQWSHSGPKFSARGPVVWLVFIKHDMDLFGFEVHFFAEQLGDLRNKLCLLVVRRLERFHMDDRHDMLLFESNVFLRTVGQPNSAIAAPKSWSSISIPSPGRLESAR